MSNRDYNLALFVFFIPYILFEVPSNIIIRRVKPSTWLAAIVTLWGIATIGQGLIRNLQGLVAMRFLLGLFEAGLFPGENYPIPSCKRPELTVGSRLKAAFISSACTTSASSYSGGSLSSSPQASLQVEFPASWLSRSRIWTVWQGTVLGDGLSSIPCY